MKRYIVKLLRHGDLKHFVIYLSADCGVSAYWKAYEFIQNAYGIGTYYLISVYQESESQDI